MNVKNWTALSCAALVLTLAACSKGERPSKEKAAAEPKTTASKAVEVASAPVVTRASEAALVVVEPVMASVPSAVVEPVTEPTVEPVPVVASEPVATKEVIIPIPAAPAVQIHGSEQTCQPVTDREVAALFDRWNASLQTGDKAVVVANYASDSILLPTVSNQVRYSRAEKEDYFAHFLENSPVGVIKERYIQVGCNTAIDAGLYEFTYQKTGDKVLARYSFTYTWDGKQWLITSHHSSAMPEQANKVVEPQKPAVH